MYRRTRDCVIAVVDCAICNSVVGITILAITPCKAAILVESVTPKTLKKF